MIARISVRMNSHLQKNSYFYACLRTLNIRITFALSQGIYACYLSFKIQSTARSGRKRTNASNADYVWMHAQLTILQKLKPNLLVVASH